MMFKFIRYAGCLRYLRLHKRLYAGTTELIQKDALPLAAYSPAMVRQDKYRRWEREGLFRPDSNNDMPNYSMVLPPPNVTGKLHLGHALGCTIQDVILRRLRSKGCNVLWVPGTDHAGIATQTVVEKYLKTLFDTNRYYLGRDRFNREVWKWKDKHGHMITDQLKTLGCSLDWNRHMFTMDPKHNHAVKTAFIQLFSKGLIYRNLGLVNWCNALKSTVSDIEVDGLELKGPTDIKVAGYPTPVRFGQMYSFAYKIFGTNDEIIVSTTMPETMMGDTAVAVHPDDLRYKDLIGKRLYHPFKRCTIPIIFDTAVDRNFGSGAVKITPAHSKIDFEIAKIHSLPMEQVIDENGFMINSCEFNDINRYECRDLLVKKLDDLGFMRSVTPHSMVLPICSRTGDVIGTLPKEQWFVSCKKMNKKAREAVTSGWLKIEPEKYVKNWLDWTSDDRDWCVSRQLWWGHQIPAYQCTLGKDSIWIAAENDDEAKTKAATFLRAHPDAITTKRDEDVLDTWFSSAIYPFSVLGWPIDTKDLNDFYPLDLMATGNDILGFWVHRMVMLGLELTDCLPFSNILLHGIICDNRGAKMSKSRGNVIDPNDVIHGISMTKLEEKARKMHKEGILSKQDLAKALDYHKANFSNTNGIPECGVDALRFTLLSQDVMSNFVNFDVSMCYANKLFCNKIWQAVKFVQLSCGRLPPTDIELTKAHLSYFDTWILSRVADMVEKVNKHLDQYEFHLATKALRSHIYNEFCDVYLEATKPGFGNNNAAVGYAHAHTLSAALNTSLRCLNPFMVYLTEELIPKIPVFQHNIIANYEDQNKKYFDYPKASNWSTWKNPDVETRVDKLLDLAGYVRGLKALCNMSSNVRPGVFVKSKDDSLMADLGQNSSVISNLARCCVVNFPEPKARNYIKSVVDKDSEIWVEVLGDNVDETLKAAKGRLQKKIEQLEKTLAHLEKKISKERYKNAVPDWNMDLDRINLTNKREELKRMQTEILQLSPGHLAVKEQ